MGQTPPRPAGDAGGTASPESRLTAGLTRGLGHEAMLPLGPCAQSPTWNPACGEAFPNVLVTECGGMSLNHSITLTLTWPVVGKCLRTIAELGGRVQASGDEKRDHSGQGPESRLPTGHRAASAKPRQLSLGPRAETGEPPESLG